MAFDISNPIGTGTYAELVVLFKACAARIAVHGQSYQIGKRMYTSADLEEVVDAITRFEALADAEETPSGIAVNYPTRRRAL